MTDYSPIIKKIVELQPDGWSEVVLYAQISKYSYEIFFHTKIDGAFFKNFELEKDFGLSHKQSRACFKNIYEMLLPDFSEKKWYVCSMIIKNTGEFVVDYEYADYSEESIKYKKMWKDKYLV